MCGKDETEEAKTEINYNPNICRDLYCTIDSSEIFNIFVDFEKAILDWFQNYV